MRSRILNRNQKGRIAMFDTLKYETREGIAHITFNKPDTLNALSREVLNELQTAFEQVKNDSEVKVVILTGEGKAFVAGADISQMASYAGVEGQDIIRQGSRIINNIELLDKPVIAAVNGFALGGGCELAMACDIRIASEKAQFGQPEVSLGIIPGFGGTQRLPKLVGKGMAKYMIMTGAYVKADEALRIGLVEKVVSPEELLPTCESIAKTIMSKAPIAIKTAKIAINNGMTLDVSTGIALESEAFGGPFCSEDRIEGMRAFLEKRTPEFKNK